MTKFKRVLSSDDVFDLHEKYDGCVFKVIEAAEQAVLSKLAEQEPVAWYVPENEYILSHFTYDKHMAMSYKHRGVNIKPLYAHPMPCVSHASDNTSCVSEKAESETQTSCQGLLDSSNHIADMRKMVTPLAQRKIQTLLDKGEYRAIENATVLVNGQGHAAIVNRGGAFYWVDNEALAREFDGVGVGDDSHHIADKRKMDDGADEALRKELDLVGLDINAYSSPKEALAALIDWHVSVAVDPRTNGGWQLIPVDPTLDMIKALRHKAVITHHGNIVNPSNMIKAAIAAAPKCTGEK